MRIYLAGPMSNIPLHNFPAFDAAAVSLRADGHEVVSPAEIDIEHGFDPSSEVTPDEYEFFLRRSLKAMLDCDAIVMLEGWRDSRGALLEFEVARAVGMTVVPLPQSGAA